MKSFATFGIESLGTVSIQHSFGRLTSDRPEGVAPDAWIRVNENLGIVVVSQEPASAAAPSSVQGYFMVKLAGAWRRLLTDSTHG